MTREQRLEMAVGCALVAINAEIHHLQHNDRTNITMDIQWLFKCVDLLEEALKKDTI